MLKKLVMPWANTDMIVCADSHFESVPTAKNCGSMESASLAVSRHKRGNFQWRTCLTYSSRIRGGMSGLLTKPVDRTNPVVGAFICMYQNRQNLFFTGGSIEKGRQYTRKQWSQEDPAANTDHNMVELTIPQPITVELYYSTFGKIDRHNRCRQESLEIKKGTKYWSEQVNLSFLVMNLVYVWLEYQGITGTAETQNNFHNYLDEEIIDNTYDRFMMQSEEGRRRNIVDSDDETFDYDNPLFGRINYAPRCVIALHVTPTKKRRKKMDGT